MLITLQLAVPDPLVVRIDPAFTLVLLIDPENEFCAPTGALYLGPEAEEAVQASATLVDRSREAGCRLLWLRSVRSPDALEFQAYNREPHLLEGTWATEYTAPLAPAEDETVICKRSHDCFNGTGLDDWLATQGIGPPDWTVLVAGVALDVCVNHAVLGCSVRGFRVALPLDCVAPRNGARAAATLWRYAQRAYSYNVFVTRSELLDWTTP